MKLSIERLEAVAETTGFRAEVLEKVIHLLSLLEGFRNHPFLNKRLALKGGTALNLFYFKLPRLSVDIDLNYIGAVARETMLAERPSVEEAVRTTCTRGGFAVRRIPEEHAGGKWVLRHESALGQGGNLQVDLNYMFRIPLWPLQTLNSYPVGSFEAREIQVLDIHELAAGKFCALLARQQARDLFDSHQLLNRDDLELERLRLAFVVYGAMNRKDWRTVSLEDVGFDADELSRQLLPLLRVRSIEENGSPAFHGKSLAKECRERLSALLPFTEPEMQFLDVLLENGEIDPSLLTADKDLQERIRQHPLLKWKALNVRKHKSI